MMNRRLLVGGIVAFLAVGTGLYACAEERATLRYRVIATVEVDGERIEASTVMESSYWRVRGPGPRGGDSVSYGEALIIDLKGRGTVFVLPMTQTDGSFSYSFAGGVRSHLGITRGLGSLTDEDFQTMRNASGRKPFEGFFGREQLPVFVAFKDEKIPSSVYEVDPKNMAASFGQGIRFIGFEIEFTKDPITQVLMKRLPWLAKDQPWSRGPFLREVGPLRPTRDLSLPYKLSSHGFFAPGSY